jgi:large subunit ribosomal protein L29
MLKITDIRGMRPDELTDKLQDLERQVFDLRAQAVTEKLENTHAIKNVRRDIARIKTVMRERISKAS